MQDKPVENYLKKELYELVKNDEAIFDFIQESSLAMVLGSGETGK